MSPLRFRPQMSKSLRLSSFRPSQKTRESSLVACSDVQRAGASDSPSCAARKSKIPHLDCGIQRPVEEFSTGLYNSISEAARRRSFAVGFSYDQVRFTALEKSLTAPENHRFCIGKPILHVATASERLSVQHLLCLCFLCLPFAQQAKQVAKLAQFPRDHQRHSVAN